MIPITKLASSYLLLGLGETFRHMWHHLDAVTWHVVHSLSVNQTSSLHLDQFYMGYRKVPFYIGHLLFVLCSSEVGNIIDRSGLKHHCYADDTKIYSCCQPSASAAVKSEVLDCIDEITAWASSNRLHINPSKSEFTWVTRYRLWGLKLQ